MTRSICDVYILVDTKEARLSVRINIQPPSSTIRELVRYVTNVRELDEPTDLESMFLANALDQSRREHQPSYALDGVERSGIALVCEDLIPDTRT